MSFFKRLKDKFSSKNEDDNQKDLDETVDSNVNSDSDSMDPNDSDEQVKPKKKHKKLSEADFDEDGLISIEDFEEIEAQKIGAKFKAGLEKSRQNFQEQLNNLIARYRKVDEDFFEALEEMLITADVGFN
ncbi:signal recognition particle receptor subunit alpha, partial [Staphylococcus aureus]|uniref:signal recognition particle receptor subunit alpha n=1 Tax=Staphylococcus aureus TaxID=1280 RepID=UPI0030F42245